MFLNKSTLAVCSSSNLPTFIWSFASITSSSQSRPTSQLARPTKPPRSRRRGIRQYATIDEGPVSAAPSHWPSSPNPTPYQIFDQKRTAPYSKARFYQLVKIYHPDRHRQTPGDTLTDAARLERYRLVVAANQILSDPAKRRAYDLYGAGWGTDLSMDNSAYRHADTSWRNEPGNPSMNATWEDWERWYGERAGDGSRHKQKTVFMSNELFVAVLCAFVVIGSMGQARRASTNTMSIVEMRDRRHAAINQEMVKRRTEQGGLGRHERVESFLRQREDWNLAPSTTSHHPHDVHNR
ncbi:hypothetical protein BJ170DRAFT_86742 [Xylariales sp. AK1849]|nr:hypothetical protein BJ170DRAFT_86742 [Xylariales sp. AK1849]